MKEPSEKGPKKPEKIEQGKEGEEKSLHEPQLADLEAFFNVHPDKEQGMRSVETPFTNIEYARARFLLDVENGIVEGREIREDFANLAEKHTPRYIEELTSFVEQGLLERAGVREYTLTEEGKERITPRH